MVEQECNTQPCPETWGCWSPWSRCAGGARTRSRECGSVEGGTAECLTGSGRDEEPCGMDVPELRSGDEFVEPISGTISLNMMIGACVCGFGVGGALGAVLVYYLLKCRKPIETGVTSPHYISAKSQNLYVSLPMLDLKHKQISSNTSDYSGTLRSNATGTLRSKTGSSVYGGKPGDYETATIKRSHSRRDSSLINGTIRADLDSEQMFS